MLYNKEMEEEHTTFEKDRLVIAKFNSDKKYTLCFPICLMFLLTGTDLRALGFFTLAHSA